MSEWRQRERLIPSREGLVPTSSLPPCQSDVEKGEGETGLCVCVRVCLCVRVLARVPVYARVCTVVCAFVSQCGDVCVYARERVCVVVEDWVGAQMGGHHTRRVCSARGLAVHKFLACPAWRACQRLLPNGFAILAGTLDKQRPDLTGAPRRAVKSP